jgi:hypothetical protein
VLFVKDIAWGIGPLKAGLTPKLRLEALGVRPASLLEALDPFLLSRRHDRTIVAVGSATSHLYISKISILYPSGSRTKQSREPPSRTEYGGFSGSMPCSASFASVASRSPEVIAMWP